MLAHGSGETLKLDDAASVLLPPDKITNSQKQNILSTTESSEGSQFHLQRNQASCGQHKHK